VQQGLAKLDDLETRERALTQRAAEADAEAERLRHERMELDDDRDALETERKEADAAMQAGSPNSSTSASARVNSVLNQHEIHVLLIITLTFHKLG
jgi:predicted aconitase